MAGAKTVVNRAKGPFRVSARTRKGLSQFLRSIPGSQPGGWLNLTTPRQADHPGAGGWVPMVRAMTAKGAKAGVPPAWWGEALAEPE